jgi:hypothetical protein
MDKERWSEIEPPSVPSLFALRLALPRPFGAPKMQLA